MANNSEAATHLGISIDESFVEFSLVKTKARSAEPEVLAQRRAYLPRESLKVSLAAFLAAHAETPPQRLFVSMRFLEKILDYKLGTSVAQLVSEGFENWMQIRSSHPTQQNLSNPDLIFPISERASANGQVLTEVTTETLEGIELKLKQAEVKRVCLNFLHSQIQPRNTKMAQEFFSLRGYDVFTSHCLDNPDEISRWRANTLSASVTSTFAELKEHIEEVCKDIVPAEQIYFLSAGKKVFQNEKQHRLGSLFSTRAAILNKQKKSSALLYLGLEKFSWLEQQTQKNWQSPWGLVDLEHPICEDLNIQPTSQIDLNMFGELDFSQKNEGYEPGPMCMGRGQKPTLLDLFAEDDKLKKTQGICERINPAGVQRFKSTLMAMAKNISASSSAKTLEGDKLISQLKKLALQKMAVEINFKTTNDFKVIGPLSSVLGPELKALYGWEISNEKFVDSISVADSGYEWMKP